jgi:hypothetical protein
MGGAAFYRLKIGRSGSETAKQAEDRAAGLPKSLLILVAGEPNLLAGCGALSLISG